MHRKVSLSRASWLVKLLPLLLFLGACATGAIREKQLTLPVIDGATSVGSETCLECHEGMGAGVHSRLAEFEYMGGTGGCEACHGGGSLHIESDGDQILKFGELLPEESAAICAKCHSDGNLMDWTHSLHAISDVGCNDCHAIHGGNKTALKQEDPELCYSCHQEQMAKASFPSHHPIAEGKMDCGDCHNPHGDDGLATDERTNDLCLDCHSRYQGPFVFGHAPVEDDCTICHDPHGSVANNLLVQNEPFLCLQCHEGHFHILRKGFNPETGTITADGTPRGSLPNPPGITGNAIDPVNVAAANPHGTEGWQMSFGTKCTSCHAVVHGSDFPSQPSTGKGLTR